LRPLQISVEVMADAAVKDNLAALEFISEDDPNTYEGWLKFRTSPLSEVIHDHQIRAGAVD
jgi:hypothetical protein